MNRVISLHKVNLNCTPRSANVPMVSSKSCINNTLSMIDLPLNKGRLSLVNDGWKHQLHSISQNLGNPFISNITTRFRPEIFYRRESTNLRMTPVWKKVETALEKSYPTTSQVFWKNKELYQWRPEALSPLIDRRAALISSLDIGN